MNRFLLLEFSVLFLEFVQQHRGQLLILNRLDFARVVINDQLWIHLSHFLCNQAILQTTLSGVVLFLVTEAHRPQPHQVTARLVHVVDVLFELPRGSSDNKDTGDECIGMA